MTEGRHSEHGLFNLHYVALHCAALGFGYLGEEFRGKKLIPPGSGRRSACPPEAGRTLP